MLRLLHGAGLVQDNASAVIRCMGHAMRIRVLFLSDVDFYEDRFGNISDELASFLLSKHEHAERESSITLLRRLLDRNARPTPGTVFTFGEAIAQDEVLHGINADLSGFIANEEYWVQQFPADWEP